MRRQDRSPFRSPRRDIISSELEEHSNKIKELLRQDLNMLEEENAILKAKCKKVGDLEEKIEIVLRQNSDLLAENEKISKLLHQKKSECEILKNKYDAVMAHRLEGSAQNEFEKKKLLAQIQHLRAELIQIERARTLQIGEIRTQHQLDLQSMKKQSVTGQQVYELEIRKLREQLDKRELENSETLNRLKRLSSQSEYEIFRLKEEKQKLKNELLYIETERKKDIQTLKNKLDMNYLEEIEVLKRSHLAGLDSLETENLRLKEYLETRNREVEDLAAKNVKQKAHFEDTIALLRKENETIRMKMMEGERFSELEIDNLKSKLHQMHQAEIEELKLNQQRYIDTMQAEISKLEIALRNKGEEIEQLIKEKTSVRQMFQSEGGRLKEELESLLVKVRELDLKNKDQSQKYEQRLKEKDNHIQYLDRLNLDQKQNADKEQNALKQIIEHQKNQLEKEKISNKEKEQNLKESLLEYKNESEILRDELRRERKQKQRKVEQLKTELDSVVTQLQTKVQTGSTKTNILEREGESLKKTIELKDKEVRNLQDRIRNSDEREKKLQKEIEQLRMKIVKKDQKANQILQEQKQRMQNSFNYTLDSLRSDHDAALKLEQAKLADAADKLKRKEKEIDDLLKAYKKMKEELEVLTEQEANKKELTLKFAGATSDLIATKNVFDVYLKTKVLDVCGDALDKDNKENFRSEK